MASKMLLLCVLFGCSSAAKTGEDNKVGKLHILPDSARGVTCYYLPTSGYGEAFSCVKTAEQL